MPPPCPRRSCIHRWRPRPQCCPPPCNAPRGPWHNRPAATASPPGLLWAGWFSPRTPPPCTLACTSSATAPAAPAPSCPGSPVSPAAHSAPLWPPAPPGRRCGTPRPPAWSQSPPCVHIPSWPGCSAPPGTRSERPARISLGAGMYFHTPPGTAAPSACPQTWPPDCRPLACPRPQTAPDPAGFLPCPCPQFRFQPRPRRPGCPGIPLPSPVHPRTPPPSLPPQRAYASRPLRPPPAASAPPLPALPGHPPRRFLTQPCAPPPPGPCPRPRPPPSALCARFWP